MTALRLAVALLIIGCCTNTASASDPTDPALHRHLESFMHDLTEVSDGKNALILAGGLLVLGREKEFETAQLLTTSLLVSAGMVGALKYAFNRQRPEGETTRKNASFPSGHAAGSFGLAAVIAGQYPRLAIPAYVFALGVTYSRLYLNRHYPLDVVAGAGLGYATSLLALKYREKITLKGKGIAGFLFFDEKQATVGITLSW